VALKDSTGKSYLEVLKNIEDSILMVSNSVRESDVEDLSEKNTDPTNVQESLEGLSLQSTGNLTEKTAMSHNQSHELPEIPEETMLPEKAEVVEKIAEEAKEQPMVSPKKNIKRAPKAKTDPVKEIDVVKEYITPFVETVTSESYEDMFFDAENKPKIAVLKKMRLAIYKCADKLDFSNGMVGSFMSILAKWIEHSEKISLSNISADEISESLDNIAVSLESSLIILHILTSSNTPRSVRMISCRELVS
jgi:hypothetical protein